MSYEVICLCTQVRPPIVSAKEGVSPLSGTQPAPADSSLPALGAGSCDSLESRASSPAAVDGTFGMKAGLLRPEPSCTCCQGCSLSMNMVDAARAYGRTS